MDDSPLQGLRLASRPRIGVGAGYETPKARLVVSGLRSVLTVTWQTLTTVFV